MPDPVPGAEDVQPTILERLQARLPKIPEVNRVKAGRIIGQTGKYVLLGSIVTMGAIAFLAKPFLTVVVGGACMVAGKHLERAEAIKNATTEVKDAAAS